MFKVFFVLLIVSISLNPVQAQNNRGPANEAALQKLDLQLENAFDLLRQFPNKQAENLLELANKNRNEAMSLFRGNRNQLANMKLKAAFTLLDQALNLLSTIPLDRIKEQVFELVLTAENALGGVKNKEAERLLKDAKQSVTRGNREMSRGKTLLAIENYRVAKFLLDRCLNLVKTNKGNLQDQLPNEKKQYEELFRRAQDMVGTCDNPHAKKLLNQAKKQHRTLIQAKNKGNAQFALKMYYSTSRLLLRAIDMCRGVDVSQGERAGEELEMLQDLIATATDELGPPVRSRDRLLLQKTNNLQRQAQTAINQGNFEIALRRIDLARNLLGRLFGEENSESFSDRTMQELTRLESDIALMEAEINNSRNNRTRVYLEAAQKCANDARKFINQDRIRLALESIFAGNRFLSVINHPQSVSITSNQQLNTELEKLAGKINTLQDRALNQNKDLLEIAQQMVNRANEAAHLQNNELAFEYIRIGNNVLDKLDQ